MENDIIRSGYNQISADYHARRLTKQAINRQYFDALSDHLPAEGKMLDLGCGSGIPVTKCFADKGFAVTGVDISEKMIEIARKEVPNGAFFVADMCQLSFPENHFDLILSTFAIIHVPREKQATLFQNLKYWLKKGGRAYLVLGSEDKAMEIKEDWHGVEMYWSHFDPETYQTLLTEIGFKMVWEEHEVLPNGESFYNVIIEK
ncbi:MAG: class I SAM-dependent methyltransferase [Bacteroidota bacterium]